MSGEKYNADLESFGLDGTEDSGTGWPAENSGSHFDEDVRISISEVCSNGRPILAASGSDGLGSGDALWGPQADNVFRRR